jgi:glycerophosphoryl diester phosphodiesterase
MKMKSTLVMLAALFVSASALASSPLYPYMDSYRIPLDKKGAVIGKIYFSTSEKMKIDYSIVQDTSKLFLIDKSGNLCLKPGKSVSAGKGAFSYGIKIKTGNVVKEFELVKDEFLTNKAIAHRGAWKNTGSTENSLSSLKAAIELGCGASEFDVWMAADGVLVINHDPHAGGFEIEKTSSAELTKVPLKKGDFVATLEQYLLTAKKQNKTALVLEIKASLVSNERLMELTEKVVKMVHDLKMQAWVNYISFDHSCLVRVLELDPAAKTAFLDKNMTLDQLKESKMWGIDFNLSMFKEDADLIKKAHDLGLTVNAWTVNKAEDMQMLLDKGADYITTNEPEMLLKMLK